MPANGHNSIYLIVTRRSMKCTMNYLMRRSKNITRSRPETIDVLTITTKRYGRVNRKKCFMRLSFKWATWKIWPHNLRTDSSLQVLDEFIKSFQERNPYLKVFSAHLQIDDATPHLHVDFVPFTTGSKCGLDTRVSLKQALANQGFTGGTRGDTEWSQWVKSEKGQLSHVMELHGIEWEQLGTHDEHLSVMD